MTEAFAEYFGSIYTSGFTDARSQHQRPDARLSQPGNFLNFFLVIIFIDLF